jgi:hypothetical protein
MATPTHDDSRTVPSSSSIGCCHFAAAHLLCRYFATWDSPKYQFKCSRQRLKYTVMVLKVNCILWNGIRTSWCLSRLPADPVLIILCGRDWCSEANTLSVCDLGSTGTLWCRSAIDGRVVVCEDSVIICVESTWLVLDST